jgi:hypothetical protein
LSSVIDLIWFDQLVVVHKLFLYYIIIDAWKFVGIKL